MADEHLPVPVEPTPLLLIQQGIDAKISPRDMKDLFDLQVRYEQRLAEQAYADAITAFQAEVPPIKKNATNPHSKKTYADYEGVMRVITPILRKHKIVITFDTSESGEKMLTTCRVRVGTVEKITTITLPVDAASKMMNATQAGGAAMSYGRRYALAAALNLVYTDEDTDGVFDAQGITEQEVEDFAALLPQAGYNSEAAVRRLFDWVAKVQGSPCDTAKDITAGALPKVLDLLSRKANERKGKEAPK